MDEYKNERMIPKNQKTILIQSPDGREWNGNNVFVYTSSEEYILVCVLKYRPRYNTNPIFDRVHV